MFVLRGRGILVLCCCVGLMFIVVRYEACIVVDVWWSNCYCSLHCL